MHGHTKKAAATLHFRRKTLPLHKTDRKSERAILAAIHTQTHGQIRANATLQAVSGIPDYGLLTPKHTQTMLKTKIAILAFILLYTAAPSQAQSKNKRVKAKAVPEMTEEEELAEELYETMLLSTAKIMFIDSVVVDSADFISKIPLNKESGRIGTYGKLFSAAQTAEGGAYINEFGNKAFYSKADADGHFSLYSADKLGGRWTAERLIDEFGGEFEDINYPYMMADGSTLYFSAKSKEGLGGYDIYVTRFNTDSAKFYRPENVGLPYNSKANDYYCVIDEFDNIGWLVTDRRQPKGKVCIYTFVPADTRTTYDGDIIGEDKLKALANITSISDTWTDKAKLQAARNRISSLKARKNETEASSMAFVVNDNTVYTSPDDFKSPANRARFNKLQQMKEAADGMAAKLETLRKSYSSGNASTKRRLADDIISMEKKLEQLQAYIHEAEKEIRNAENMQAR